jgi:hypothetical protein
MTIEQAPQTTESVDTQTSTTEPTKIDNVENKAEDTQSNGGSLLNEADASDSVADVASDTKVEDTAKMNEADKVIEYQDFVIPEGMQKNEDLINNFIPLAKELKLTQEQAQKLVDLQTSALMADREKSLKDFEEFKEQTRNETKNYLGVDYKKELSYAKKAIDTFLSGDEKKEFMTFLDETGIGDRKEFINILRKVGKEFTEGRFVEGKNNTKKEIDPALSLAGGLYKKK